MGNLGSAFRKNRLLRRKKCSKKGQVHPAPIKDTFLDVSKMNEAIVSGFNEGPDGTESLDSDFIEFDVKDIIDYACRFYLQEEIERIDEDGDLVVLTEEQGKISKKKTQ